MQINRAYNLTPIPVNFKCPAKTAPLSVQKGFLQKPKTGQVEGICGWASSPHDLVFFDSPSTLRTIAFTDSEIL